MEYLKKVKAWCFASFDGLLTRADGGIDFILEYPDLRLYDYGFTEFYRSVSCGVMSHRQYKELQKRSLWPLTGKPCHIVTQDPFVPASDKDIHFMYCNLAATDLFAREIIELQQTVSNDIWLVGDYELLAVAMERKIITELTVNILPITIGNGMPLFSLVNSECLWSLESYCKYDNGIFQVRYRRL